MYESEFHAPIQKDSERVKLTHLIHSVVEWVDDVILGEPGFL